MKVCSKCKEITPLDQMVKCSRRVDGLSSRCKKCHSETSQRSVKSNPESRKKISAEYFKKNRVKCSQRNIAWQKANPEKMAESAKKYRQAHPERVKEYRKRTGLASLHKLREKYPDRHKARNRVNNAVAKGNIPPAKTLACFSCQNTATEYHHHKGYDEAYWLDVVPVCKRCHTVLR